MGDVIKFPARSGGSFIANILLVTIKEHSTAEPLFTRLLALAQDMETARILKMREQFKRDTGSEPNLPEWYEADPEKVGLKERRKFWALDIGLSGAFLIEKVTGEIYNIQGYGKADKNKKKKANLGNVFGLYCNGEYLLQNQYNYLR
jgi:hypothetical protein